MSAGFANLLTGTIADAKFSEDGSQLFIARGDTVFVYDVGTLRIVARFDFDKPLAGFDISPDGSTLVVALLQSQTAGIMHFGVANLAQGSMSTLTIGTGGFGFNPHDVSILASGDVLFSFSSSKDLFLLDIATGSFTKAADTAGTSANLIETSDGTQVYAVDSYYQATGYVYSDGIGLTASKISTVNPYAGASVPRRMGGAGAISDDGSLILFGDTTHLYDASLNFLRSTDSSASFGADFDETNGLIYSSAGGDLVVAVDVQTGEAQAAYRIGRSVSSPFDVRPYYGDLLRVDSDGSHLSVITTNGVVLVDLRQAVPVATSGDDIITEGFTLIGLGGNDRLGGDLGGQTMSGGKGDDIYFIAQAGDDAYELPDQGNDTVFLSFTGFYGLGENIENLVITTAGNSIVYGNDIDNSIVGSAGDDRISGQLGNDIIDGGAGFDIAYYESAPATVDLALQSVMQNTGVNGFDTLISIEGLVSGQGDDTLLGNSGDNWLESDLGDDFLDGRLGNDTILAGMGNDTIRLSGGIDVVDGGGDYDTAVISGAGGNSPLVISTTAGITRVTRLSGDANLSLDSSLTGVEQIRVRTSTTAPTNTVNAENASVAVQFWAGVAEDVFVGGAGNDEVIVEATNPAGGDTFTGNGGFDSYDFTNALDGLEGTTITDFAQGDIIALNSGGAAGTTISRFIGEAAFSGFIGEYRFERTGTTTLVQFDRDGDGVADGTLTLNGEMVLRAATNANGAHNLVFSPVILGKEVAEVLSGTLGNDEIMALGGSDQVSGLRGNDTIDGGEGDDVLLGDLGDDILTGGLGNDRLLGGSGDDDMRGGAGDDSYFVDNAGDLVIELAGEGTDSIRSGVNWTLGNHIEILRLAGAATLGTGNALANVLFGGREGATLAGLDGDDTIYGSNKADTITGGNGLDTLFGNAGIDTIRGGADNDTINGGGNGDFLYGDSGNDTIRGSTGNDHLYGGTGNDILRGELNNDTLRGEAGADTLLGEDGVDILIGGADRDIMTGGLGADDFVFGANDFVGLTASTADRIVDFNVAQGDDIDLSAIDSITGGVDDAFDYIGNTAFSGTAGELRWAHEGANTMIYLDINGDALADYAIRLDGNINLAATSFIL